MSRTNGEFPKYQKLDISSLDWPANYWDKSLECKTCEKKWPHHTLFSITPCCRASTKLADEAPDMRWPEAVLELQTSRFDALYDQWNEDTTDQQLVLEEEIKQIQEAETIPTLI